MRNNLREARSWGSGVIARIAAAIRMMHRQKCGNRLPWPMITPHFDEIKERNPESDRDYRELSADSAGGSTHFGKSDCKVLCPSGGLHLPLIWPGGALTPLRNRGRGARPIDLECCPQGSKTKSYRGPCTSPGPRFASGQPGEMLGVIMRSANVPPWRLPFEPRMRRESSGQGPPDPDRTGAWASSSRGCQVPVLDR